MGASGGSVPLVVLVLVSMLRNIRVVGVGVVVVAAGLTVVAPSRLVVVPSTMAMAMLLVRRR